MKITRPENALGMGVSAGFAAVLLLMIALISVGLMRMADINRRMAQIVQDTNIKIELSHTMKDALRERALTMHVISLMTDPFDQQAEFVNMNEYGDSFVAARSRLESMDLAPGENAIIERIHSLTKKTQPMVVEAIDKVFSGKTSEAREMILQDIIPAQKLLAFEVNDLLKLQRERAEKTVAEAVQAYERARLLMIVLGLAAAGVGCVIAFVVVRRTNHLARTLQHQAMFDSLTDLPNRALFADRLRQAVLIGSREKERFALIAMDLDRFKEINDTMGHHVGDKVLQKVSARARSCLRESDTVARMGGDEFTILLPTVLSLEGAITVAQKILKAVNEPLLIGDQNVEMGASLGIVMFPEHGDEASALMREADAAMYQAKRMQGGIKVYSAELAQKADDHAVLQGELRHAIASGELVLHYQPKIDCDSNRISGVEALVRWQHPKKGLLYPDMFIPLAEQSALIKPLTQSVLRSALRQCEEWHKAGLNLAVAVNISAINVQDPEFPAQVAELLQEFSVPASRLELEITETAVMIDPARAVECIKKLSALGLQIAIDDFGTGYSSMTYLKKLLVAKIKIDRSFVKEMAVNHNDAVIVRSAVELGHNLGLKVIAEGVENQAVWNELKSLGCDSAQGYYMARPLAPDKFMEWLRQSPWGFHLPGPQEQALDGFTE